MAHDILNFTVEQLATVYDAIILKRVVNVIQKNEGYLYQKIVSTNYVLNSQARRSEYLY